MSCGQVPAFILQSIHDGIEQVSLEAAPESFAFGRVIEIAAVADDYQIEAGDYEQDLIASAGAGDCVTWDFGPDGVEIRVPAQAAGRLRIARRPIGLRRPGVAQHRLDPSRVEQLPALPLYFDVYNFGVSEQVHDVQVGRLNAPWDRFRTADQWYMVVERVTVEGETE